VQTPPIEVIEEDYASDITHRIPPSHINVMASRSQHSENFVRQPTNPIIAE